MGYSVSWLRLVAAPWYPLEPSRKLVRLPLLLKVRVCSVEFSVSRLLAKLIKIRASWATAARAGTRVVGQSGGCMRAVLASRVVSISL